MANTTKRSRTKTKGPKKKQSVLGWRTNDEDEIKRRRLRAASEPLRVKSVEAQPRFFGSYLVTTTNRGAYRVEVRSLGERINTCECPDFQISGLGTCKHIEAVMLQLQKSGKKRFAAAAEQGSPRIEIFLDRHEQPPCVRVVWPRNSNRRSLARKRLEPFFSEERYGQASRSIPNPDFSPQSCLNLSRLLISDWGQERLHSGISLPITLRDYLRV